MDLMLDLMILGLPDLGFNTPEQAALYGFQTAYEMLFQTEPPMKMVMKWLQAIQQTVASERESSKQDNPDQDRSKPVCDHPPAVYFEFGFCSMVRARLLNMVGEFDFEDVVSPAFLTIEREEEKRRHVLDM